MFLYFLNLVSYFSFSLTLVDTLDTLVVVGEYDEFERAVQLIVENVKFDADLVVSVFETNIRMVGGLISGNCLSYFSTINAFYRPFNG